MDSAAARIFAVIAACFALLAVLLFTADSPAAGIAAAFCAVLAVFGIARALGIITGPPVEPEPMSMPVSTVGLGQQRVLCDPFVLHGRRVGAGFSIDGAVVHQGASDCTDPVKVQLTNREWTQLRATGVEHPLLDLHGHIHDHDFEKILGDALLPWGLGDGPTPESLNQLVNVWQERSTAGHVDGFALTSNHLMLLRYEPPEAASVDRSHATKQVRRVYPLSAVGA